MPRVSKSRSPAQRDQLLAVNNLRKAHREGKANIAGEQAQNLQLQTKVKDLQQQLRNERKRSKRAKAAHLEDVGSRENANEQAPTQDEEVDTANTKLVEMREKLETKKKNIRALEKKVTRFPQLKKRAIQKALHEPTLLTDGSWPGIKTKSGRISTPARNIVRKLVLHHKVSTSQAGGVLSTLMNAGPEEEISARSSRRIVNEVGVGNKVRVAKEVKEAIGEHKIVRRRVTQLTVTN